MTTSPNPSSDDRSYSAVTSRFYAKQVADVVRRLRGLADEVEREGRARPGVMGRQDGRPEYVHSAQQIVHAVTWGLANLNLDGVISAGNEADQAARDPEVQT